MYHEHVTKYPSEIPKYQEIVTFCHKYSRAYENDFRKQQCKHFIRPVVEDYYVRRYVVWQSKQGIATKTEPSSLSRCISESILESILNNQLKNPASEYTTASADRRTIHNLVLWEQKSVSSIYQLYTSDIIDTQMVIKVIENLDHQGT